MSEYRKVQLTAAPEITIGDINDITGTIADKDRYLLNTGGTRINPATEDTLSGIKTQTDKLTFDDLLALFINRVDSISSLRKSLTIPDGSLFQIPDTQKVIVKDYILTQGDLYIEGKLVVV